MPRQTSPTLTEAELRLMQVLWQKRRATVADVAEAMQESHAPAYTTVLTTMRILERKGYVRHEKEGRAFIYEPVVDQNEACRDAVRHLLTRFFDNSPERLVLNLLEDDAMDAKELRKLKKLVQES
jgi:predicted transcriptional regulator